MPLTPSHKDRRASLFEELVGESVYDLDLSAGIGIEELLPLLRASLNTGTHKQLEEAEADFDDCGEEHGPSPNQLNPRLIIEVAPKVDMTPPALDRDLQAHVATTSWVALVCGLGKLIEESAAAVSDTVGVDGDLVATSDSVASITAAVTDTTAVAAILNLLRQEAPRQLLKPLLRRSTAPISAACAVLASPRLPNSDGRCHAITEVLESLAACAGVATVSALLSAHLGSILRLVRPHARMTHRVIDDDHTSRTGDGAELSISEAEACLWLITSIQYPNLDKHLGVAVPFLLELVEHYSPRYQAAGLQGIRYLLKHVLSNEIKLMGLHKVLLAALERQMHGQTPEVWHELGPTLASVLQVVQPFPTASRASNGLLATKEYDKVVVRILQDMSYETKLALSIHSPTPSPHYQHYTQIKLQV